MSIHVWEQARASANRDTARASVHGNADYKGRTHRRGGRVARVGAYTTTQRELLLTYCARHRHETRGSGRERERERERDNNLPIPQQQADTEN